MYRAADTLLATAALALRDWIYPQYCLLSGARLALGTRELSEKALRHWHPTGFGTAAGPDPLTDRLRHMAAPNAGPDTVRACFYYRESLGLDALVHRMKYLDRPSLAHRLGELMATLTPYYTPEALAHTGAAAVVPVPLHADRLRARGYNQAERLARGWLRASAASSALDLRAVLRPGLLRRVRATASQTGLDRAARRANVAAAFVVAEPPPHAVWLVDDVFTTGATVLEAAQTLRRAGVAWVGVQCLAWAGSPEDLAWDTAWGTSHPTSGS